MDVWSALLSISVMVVAGTLVWAMLVSSRFRHEFAHAMPLRVREALSSLYFGLWLVVALLVTGAVSRMVLAFAGSDRLISAAMTGITASLALMVAWSIGHACWRLHRSL